MSNHPAIAAYVRAWYLKDEKFGDSPKRQLLPPSTYDAGSQIIVELPYFSFQEYHEPTAGCITKAYKEVVAAVRSLSAEYSALIKVADDCPSPILTHYTFIPSPERAPMQHARLKNGMQPNPTVNEITFDEDYTPIYKGQRLSCDDGAPFFVYGGNQIVEALRYNPRIMIVAPRDIANNVYMDWKPSITYVQYTPQSFSQNHDFLGKVNAAIADVLDFPFEPVRYHNALTRSCRLQHSHDHLRKHFPAWKVKAQSRSLHPMFYGVVCNALRVLETTRDIPKDEYTLSDGTINWRRLIRGDKQYKAGDPVYRSALNKVAVSHDYLFEKYERYSTSINTVLLYEPSQPLAQNLKVNLDLLEQLRIKALQRFDASPAKPDELPAVRQYRRSQAESLFDDKRDEVLRNLAINTNCLVWYKDDFWYHDESFDILYKLSDLVAAGYSKDKHIPYATYSAYVAALNEYGVNPKGKAPYYPPNSRRIGKLVEALAEELTATNRRNSILREFNINPSELLAYNSTKTVINNSWLPSLDTLHRKYTLRLDVSEFYCSYYLQVVAPTASTRHNNMLAILAQSQKPFRTYALTGAKPYDYDGCGDINYHSIHKAEVNELGEAAELMAHAINSPYGMYDAQSTFCINLVYGVVPIPKVTGALPLEVANGVLANYEPELSSVTVHPDVINGWRKAADLEPTVPVNRTHKPGSYFD